MEEQKYKRRKISHDMVKKNNDYEEDLYDEDEYEEDDDYDEGEFDDFIVDDNNVEYYSDEDDSEYIDDGNNNDDNSESDEEADIINILNDEITLDILKKISKNKNLDEIIFELKKEKNDIKKSINKNFSAIVKDNIHFQLQSFDYIIDKLKKENSKNFDIQKFISKEQENNQELLKKTVKDNIDMVLNSSKPNETLYNEIVNFGQDKNNLSNYIKNLNDNDKKEYYTKIKEIKTENKTIPNALQVLNLNTSNKNKNAILSMISEYENMHNHDTDKTKHSRWINKIMKVPFGKYFNPPIKSNARHSKIKKYLNNLKNLMDEKIFGHEDTKQQLIKIIAQNISNQNESGNVFSLCGSPGVGKTEFIKNVIAPCLKRPFYFISLAGISDGSILEGHSFTYVGSICGKIVEALIETQCMNPILYFDELDKISETTKGQEIANILIKLTDKTQNKTFHDLYFNGIDFDLSQALMIFSFNNRDKINPILEDRMKIIKVDGYDLNDKLQIAKLHLIPELKKEIGINFEINMTDEALTFIIENYTNESGVRKIKEKLKDIFLELNLRFYTENKNNFNIDLNMIENDLLKTHYKIDFDVIENNKFIVGSCNGMYATDNGMIGGTMNIKSSFVYSNKSGEMILTGSLEKVMKEMSIYSKTIAWNILPANKKKKLFDKLQKETIHIHFGDTATKKDGPSAGCITMIIILSLFLNEPLNQDFAMTGELDGIQVKKIGGLSQKLYGCKKNGIRTALVPKENKKDLEKILNKNKNLIDENFNVIMVDTVYEAIDLIFQNKIDYVKI